MLTPSQKLGKGGPTRAPEEDWQRKGPTTHRGAYYSGTFPKGTVDLIPDMNRSFSIARRAHPLWKAIHWKQYSIPMVRVDIASPSGLGRGWRPRPSVCPRSFLHEAQHHWPRQQADTHIRNRLADVFEGGATDQTVVEKAKRVYAGVGGWGEDGFRAILNSVY